MKVLLPLYRSESGVGKELLGPSGEFVAPLSAVWKGEGSPVGSVIKLGSSRYPKYYKVEEA